MQKSLIISTLFLFLISCSDNAQNNQDGHIKSGQTVLTTSFNPAFEENSEIVYSVNELSQNLSMLIKSKDGDRFHNDTFLYRAKVLINNEVRFLDSMIVKLMPIPTVDRKDKISDGITINFDLIRNGDTVKRHFVSPTKSENVVGFIITSNAVNAFTSIFNDSLVSDYFVDIYSYINDSAILPNPTVRPIVKLRMAKYGWKLK